MTSCRFTAVLLFCIAALNAPPAIGQNAHRFQVVNVSTQSIIHLYVSPSGSANWGPDRLEAPLGPRSAQPFNVPPNECQFDVRAIYENGHTVLIKNYDICASAVIEVSG